MTQSPAAWEQLDSPLHTHSDLVSVPSRQHNHWVWICPLQSPMTMFTDYTYIEVISNSVSRQVLTLSLVQSYISMCPYVYISISIRVYMHKCSECLHVTARMHVKGAPTALSIGCTELRWRCRFIVWYLARSANHPTSYNYPLVTGPPDFIQLPPGHRTCSFIRAVPEIILGGCIFFQTPPPPGHTWSQSPPTPRTCKCFS